VSEHEDNLRNVVDEMERDRAAASCAPVEQYARAGECVRIVGARAAMDAAGCNDASAFPKVCVALAAAAIDDSAANAWRELALAPRVLVLNVARPIARSEGTWDL
jgi:hypothetical protein